MTSAVVQVDAFTDRPFAGNPAAVCVLSGPAPEAWMQALAREMNLSETAFLRREGEAWRLRWFTPVAEVDLCGHATLASAHVLWEDGHLPAARPARFLTLSGELQASRQGDRIRMDFPAEAPFPEAPSPGLGPSLGVTPVWAGRNRMDWLLQVAGEAEVRSAAPDFGALRRMPARGFIVTAQAAPGGDADFVSRFFAPAFGVDEDPVTGSAHCALAPFWAERLGRTELTGRQLSARGGVVQVEAHGDRVALIGRAVTVLRATLAAGAGPDHG